MRRTPGSSPVASIAGAGCVANLAVCVHLSRCLLSLIVDVKEKALAGDRIAPSPFGRVGILFARAETKPALDALMAATLGGELYSVLA